jgi:hypothetical protein
VFVWFGYGLDWRRWSGVGERREEKSVKEAKARKKHIFRMKICTSLRYYGHLIFYLFVPSFSWVWVWVLILMID